VRVLPRIISFNGRENLAAISGGVLSSTQPRRVLAITAACSAYCTASSLTSLGYWPHG
jgi:hypothetical protein